MGKKPISARNIRVSFQRRMKEEAGVELDDRRKRVGVRSKMNLSRPPSQSEYEALIADLRENEPFPHYLMTYAAYVSEKKRRSGVMVP